MSRSRGSRKKKRSEKRFYAVSSGRTVGIFDTWNEASKSVTAFPKATHRCYQSLAAAKCAMRQAGIENPVIFKGSSNEHQNFEGEDETRVGEEDEFQDETTENRSETTVEGHDDTIPLTTQEQRFQNCQEDDQTLVKTLINGEKTEEISKQRKLTCSSCKSKIPWMHTKLPVYQLCLFVRTQRKFTCEDCAQAMLDEKIVEDVSEILTEEEESLDNNHAIKNNNVILLHELQLLKLEQSEGKRMIQNMENAILNLAEQIQLTNRSHKEEIKELTDMLSTHPKTRQQDVTTQTTYSDILTYSTSVKEQLHEKKQKVPKTTCQPQKNGSMNHDISIEMTPEKSCTKPMTSSGIEVNKRVDQVRDITSKSPYEKMENKDHEAEKAMTSTTSNNLTSSRNPRVKKKNKSPISVLKRHRREDSFDFVDSTASESNSDEDQEDVVFENLSRQEHREEENSLPTVYLIHDSVLKHVDPGRMQKTYGLKIVKKHVVNIKDCQETVENIHKTPDAIMFHVGVNDIKKEKGQRAAKMMTKCVEAAKQRFKEAKVVVSKIIPTNVMDLNTQREVFNAVCAADMAETGISFVSHENVYSLSNRDGIHPTMKGAAVLARNIGQHLDHILWERQGNHHSEHQAARPIQQHTGHYHRQFHHQSRPPPFERRHQQTGRQRTWESNGRWSGHHHSPPKRDSAFMHPHMMRPWNWSPQPRPRDRYFF